MRRLAGSLRISQVAEMLGWKYDKTRDHLLTLNAELGGLLLTSRGSGRRRRYTITLAALRRCMPDWFESVENLTSRVEEIEDALKEQTWRVKTVACHVGSLTADVVRLKKR